MECLAFSMSKHVHEIRDPIHVFIHLDTDERRVLDSAPFQRLRHIHQLAMSYLVYPGATHRRFEHSLGVMELAERVFRVITALENRHEKVRAIFPADDQLTYWRRVLRMAALCHDIGHFPFSHAAEALLPDGSDHEDMTLRLIQSPEMQEIWNSITPPLRSQDIAKLAVGPKKLSQPFSEWEAILSEIIIGDAFGVDRMDYLLRDSLHAGVAYGRFDHFRLIDTLRVLPESDESERPVLGLESGGVESAEALLLARYFMYSQVYFHRVRRAYNLHLQEFLAAWRGSLLLPMDLADFLDFTDDVVLVEIRKASHDDSHPGHESAKRIMNRRHYRVLYERNPYDLAKNPEAAAAIVEALQQRFSGASFFQDTYRQKGSGNVFPVKARDNRILSSLAVSEVLQKVPVIAIDYIFAPPEVMPECSTWLAAHRERIIANMKGDES